MNRPSGSGNCWNAGRRSDAIRPVGARAPDEYPGCRWRSNDLRSLQLLNDLCVDAHQPVGPDNPLRQAIVNTHSPAVVGLVRDDDLLVAQSREINIGGARTIAAGFSWLGDTWRHAKFPDVQTVSRGVLGAYLNPLAYSDPLGEPHAANGHGRPPRRVKDRDDLQPLLPFMTEP